MTPDQIELVQDSYAHLVENGSGDLLARRFYDRLSVIDPTVGQEFSNDVQTKRKEFLDELDAIVGAISDPETFAPRTRELLERYVGNGLQARQYRAVGEALLDALVETMGDDVELEVINAWSMAYDLVLAAMLPRGRSD